MGHFAEVCRCGRVREQFARSQDCCTAFCNGRCCFLILILYFLFLLQVGNGHGARVMASRQRRGRKFAIGNHSGSIRCFPIAVSEPNALANYPYPCIWRASSRLVRNELNEPADVDLSYGCMNMKKRGDFVKSNAYYACIKFITDGNI